MKEYNRYVIWVDYFNSELKRNQGRRVPLSSATKSPRLDELQEACRRLNLQPQPQMARFPGGQTMESGYVSVAKEKPKQSLVVKIARELAVVRGQAQRKQSQQKKSRKR